MILYYQELKDRYGIKWEDDPNDKIDYLSWKKSIDTEKNFYDYIRQLRKIIFEGESEKIIQKIKGIVKLNNDSLDLRKNLLNYSPNKSNKVSELLKLINPPPYKDFHIIFALDCSGSMSCSVRSSAGKETRWTALVGAVKTFINKRRMANARDIVTIVEHDHKFYNMCEAQPLDTNFESYLQFYSGGNDFAVALSGCKQIIDRNDHQSYVPLLLFLSDGGCGNGEREMEQIGNEHKKNGLILKCLGYCDAGVEKMKGLANLGGGEFINSVDGIQLESTFGAIVKTMEEEGNI